MLLVCLLIFHVDLCYLYLGHAPLTLTVLKSNKRYLTPILLNVDHIHVRSVSAPGSTKQYIKAFQNYSSLKSEAFKNSDCKTMVSFYLSLAVLNFMNQVLPAAL